MNRLLTLLFLMTAPLVAAQGVAPAIRVNDSVVTSYEIDQRALLLQAFGAAGDTRALAREQLIDDRLKMEVVRRVELEPTEEEIDAGLADFAARRQLEVGQVEQALEARGIDVQSLRDFIAVSLGWRDAVQAIFRPRARPTDADLDAALARETAETQESVLLQELVFALDGDDATTSELARRVSRELNRGGNFDAAVSRYSEAPSRERGGRIDWVPANELPGPVRNQVLALMPGEVTAPIPVRGGIAIFKLRDMRIEARAPTAAPDLVAWYELIQALPADAAEGAVLAARTRATRTAQDLAGCADMETRTAEFDAGSGRRRAPQGEVPPTLAQALAPLAPGDTAVVEDTRGVVLVMLCGRGEDAGEDREAVRLQIFNERMDTYAQGFLQELRGSAVIVEQ